MKLDWRQIRLFGVNITLPAIVVLVQQLNPDQVAQFQQYKADMAECPKCHRLFGGGAGLSFILHLQDEHNVESEHSMVIVSELSLNKLRATAARREARQTVNS
jgi:hypothetical protein